MNRHPIICVFAFMGVVTLAGCGDKPEPSSQVGIGAAAPVVAEPAGALGPRYEATLADGIDFKKPGYPKFLIEVSGVSGHEDWGRWTDAAAGATARFRFNQPLPQKFTLELKANAFGPNLGQPVKVRVGGLEKEFVVKDSQAVELHLLTFEGVNGVDTIEIIPPKPTSPRELDPQNADQRLLGLSLVSLQIKN